MRSESGPHFDFMATGIGSVPFLEVDASCRLILEHLPSAPFWPQLVRRSPLEDMMIQYSEGLPLLEIAEAKRALVVSASLSAESELVTFYDHFLAEDTDYFAISPRFAAGLHSLMEHLAQRGASGVRYLKGQTTGPITFSASVHDVDGRALIHHPELLEAMTRGLAIKALWQVRQLEKWGKPVILFLDEPYLSGYGSAFTPIQRDIVVDNIRFVLDYLKSRSGCSVGIHCCGNTDWPMILETGADIVNFDAFEYMDSFLLYPNEIRRFLEDGRTIAWGIVPTGGDAGDLTVHGLRSKMEAGIARVREWGVDPRLLARHSILTTSCGMGTMTPTQAETALSLLSRLSMEMSGLY
jgi:hypothetical protein